MHLSKIRPDVVQSLEDYANHGVETGGFLRAVLENDLMEAMGRADEDNRRSIFDICGYLYNEMPSTCWGSKEKVAAWLEKKAEERRTAALAHQI